MYQTQNGFRRGNSFRDGTDLDNWNVRDLRRRRESEAVDVEEEKARSELLPIPAAKRAIQESARLVPDREMISVKF